MAVNASASPTPRDMSTSPFGDHSDELGSGSSPVALGHVGVKRNNQTIARTDSPIPLTTSKLGNQASRAPSRKPSKKLKTGSSPVPYSDGSSDGSSPMDALLAKLSEQQSILDKQKHDLAAGGAETLMAPFPKDLPMTSSVKPSPVVVIQNGRASTYYLANVPSKKPQLQLLTKLQNDASSNDDNSMYATDDKPSYTPATEAGEISTDKPDAAEMFRLKKELDAANSRIARMDEELSQTRITHHTVNQALGPATESGFDPRGDVSEHTISKLQYAFNSAARIPAGMARQDTWPPHDDRHAAANDALATGAFSRNRNAIWGNNGAKPGLPYQVSAPVEQGPGYGMNVWNAPGGRQPFGTNMGVGLNPPSYGPAQQSQQYGAVNMNGFPMDGAYRGNNQIDDAGHCQMGRANPPSRPTSAFGGRNTAWAPNYPYNTQVGGSRFSPPVANMSSMQANMYQGAAPYQPGPIGSRLSPTAAEFSVVNDGKSSGWGAPVDPSASTYISPNEPVNYRRLLDRNVSCDWTLIVDKIVRNNDQQASIFLQQKLKVGTAEQKFAIVESIIARAYSLMINRFGNFLVQRCFEHGTQEQVIAIAQAIRGNTLTLSMDAFGCHVIQKAFDAVPEEYKAIMVHELLRRIPETVVHRYACHVWQKLFELRWADSPPQIMKYVNEALRGMWHEVALGETGSLVVQNIFENCLEEDKRPCIEEVLASIDIISHGQFGNWCIQHICEHGAPQDRTRAIDHILRYATEYSMDQYASKVVEKCLKIGGTEFLDRYLDRVCEGRPDRPRMPLIDIAGDQFGNYLIQYILTNSSPQHREIVASHVRKHMVSLRGSKYGSRVAMLCCNPAFATRPGPPTGMQLNRGNSYGNGRGFGGYR